ncbi:hypothetical protein SAMN02745121_07590 [Nannocystis exedens]|uniref:Uncharacterized protein n=1 Tax=Nannocystis exedens TaxID=54 RepID=A0A1I2GYK8_9BACT|nr:hypothetical protein NAEX_01901 [Nannocystis exedens]SFF22348.1 hypothetical protein SAMN02745121_07590 [Nannocystis exedens]
MRAGHFRDLLVGREGGAPELCSITFGELGFAPFVTGEQPGLRPLAPNFKMRTAGVVLMGGAALAVF